MKTTMAFTCLFARSAAFETDALPERAKAIEVSRSHAQGVGIFLGFMIIHTFHITLKPLVLHLSDVQGALPARCDGL